MLLYIAINASVLQSNILNEVTTLPPSLLVGSHTFFL